MNIYFKMMSNGTIFLAKLHVCNAHTDFFNGQKKNNETIIYSMLRSFELTRMWRFICQLL